MDSNKFKELDFGTKSATPIQSETIVVEVCADRFAGEYVKALVNELKLTPDCCDIYEKQPITEEEVMKYLTYLLAERVKIVNGEGTRVGRLKCLYIPCYWQFVLTCVGTYRDRQIAVDVKPTFKGETITFEEAKIISEKLGTFEAYIGLVRAAMPMDPSGDASVMTSVIIDDTIRSCNREKHHVAYDYVVAAAGLKLQKEVLFQSLFRVEYDSIPTILQLVTFRQLVGK